ncbi:hypothetical protein ACFX2A_027545 [Malus domestica]
MDSKPLPSSRHVKDVGLHPMPIDDDNPSRWPSEFNKLQREVIELWDARNVSLVHRTYFFLLFKGDPSDSIYMEVEVRRLSFLKDTFSRGDQTLEDGQSLNTRFKQMRRRLSEDERNNLYQKWGISLHSKHRRLQSANLLWSNTQNLDHIMDSATIIAKLVGSVEPEQAFKEMFGLRFAPRDTVTKRKSHFWLEMVRKASLVSCKVIESSAREFLGYDKSSSLTAVVNFVDLAGSERASQTLSAGARLKEGCHINRSLLTLGTVIRKLSKGRSGHVPYRDSKLTRILQSSLGGNARTAIICTMSPAHSHVEQSRNTLLFASCAKEVTTSAQVNVVMSDKALVKHLQKELTRLENELRGSGHKIVSADSSTILREKDLQIEKVTNRLLLLSVRSSKMHLVPIPNISKTGQRNT